MSADIAFCPLCAGKLDSEEDAEQFRCVECESAFLIQQISDDDDEDEEDDEDEDEDGDEDDERDEDDEDKDEY